MANLKLSSRGIFYDDDISLSWGINQDASPILEGPEVYSSKLKQAIAAGRVLETEEDADAPPAATTPSIRRPPYVQEDDPGAVGTGIPWVDTSEDPPVLKLRNADNDGWDSVGGDSGALDTHLDDATDPHAAAGYETTTGAQTKVDAAITALKNGVAAGGDTLKELHDRLAIIEALGSLATDSELAANLATILGSATSDADTLGELEALNALRMLKSANLSDVANVSTALTNLGVSAFIKTLLDDADAAAARATLGVAGFELAYVEKTTSVGTAQTAEANATELVSAGAVTFDGTPVWIEFFCPYVDVQNTANAYSTIELFDGATSIGHMGTVRQPTTAEMVVPVLCKRRITPSAGSHTYSVRAITSGGTSTYEFGAGGIGVYPPGYIRITKA